MREPSPFVALCRPADLKVPLCSDACDGTINHHGRGGQQFLYKGMNQSAINAHNITIPLFEPAPGDMVLDPSTVHTLHPAPGCKKTILLESLESPRVGACDRRVRFCRRTLPGHGDWWRRSAIPEHISRQDRAERQRAAAAAFRLPSNH